jgi:hypothetical protein
MARYLIEKVIQDEVEADPDNLVTIRQASDLLNLAVQTISTMADAGRLTILIDPAAKKRQARRLLLRAEVEALARARQDPASIVIGALPATDDEAWDAAFDAAGDDEPEEAPG